MMGGARPAGWREPHHTKTRREDNGVPIVTAVPIAEACARAYNMDQYEHESLHEITREVVEHQSGQEVVEFTLQRTLTAKTYTQQSVVQDSVSDDVSRYLTPPGTHLPRNNACPGLLPLVPRVFSASSRQAIDVGGNLEGKDVFGKWWPITIRGINADGTYIAEVYDGTCDNKIWPQVHEANIRPAAISSSWQSRPSASAVSPTASVASTSTTPLTPLLTPSTIVCGVPVCGVKIVCGIPVLSPIIGVPTACECASLPDTPTSGYRRVDTPPDSPIHTGTAHSRPLSSPASDQALSNVRSDLSTRSGAQQRVTFSESLDVVLPPPPPRPTVGDWVRVSDFVYEELEKFRLDPTLPYTEESEAALGCLNMAADPPEIGEIIADEYDDQPYEVRGPRGDTYWYREKDVTLHDAAWFADGPVELSVTQCTMCHGTGKDEHDAEEDCDECGGTGLTMR